jgi:hypothetical protein
VGGTAAAGSTCSPTIGCATGDYCQIDAGAKKGTCIVEGSIGSKCTPDEANCSAAAPYCDLNVTPKGGTAGKEGSCELGLSFAVGGDDCNAFGGSN